MSPSMYFGTRARPYYERAPLILIDIGARGGLQPNWKRALPHLRLVGFEPEPAEYQRLAAHADARTTYINAAVGREAAELTLNIGREGGTSSFFEPNMDFLKRFPHPERYEVVRQVRIETHNLDSLLPRHGIDSPDFIKIDTQGAELDILQGAQACLERSIFGVEVEVLFAPLYRGQPSFGAVDELLTARGFQLFDLRHSNWKRVAGAQYGGPKGQLAFGDALYLKTEAAFGIQLEALIEEDERASKLLRALSICVLYGYVDYAVELFQEHGERLEPELASEVVASLRSHVDAASLIPGFRGKGWLSHLFYRLHRAFYPTVDGWASGGRHIGNVD